MGAAEKIVGGRLGYSPRYMTDVRRTLNRGESNRGTLIYTATRTAKFRTLGLTGAREVQSSEFRVQNSEFEEVILMWKQHLAMAALVLGSAYGLVHLTRVDRVADDRRVAPLTKPQRQSIEEAARGVDQQFVAHWKREGLEVAQPASEMLVIRRLSLGLAGTVPSLEEVRVLERLPADERIDWWLERLFADRRYSDFVAERFARAFVGTDNGPFLIFRRGLFVHWLSDQVYENRSYDAIVRDMIGGRGTGTGNPAVNFIIASYNDEEERPDPIRLAGRTSRAFLGLRIDCVQCHDDFLGNVELGEVGDPRDAVQRDFHQLAAFYPEAQVTAVGLDDRPGTYSVQLLGDDVKTKLGPAVPFRPDLLPREGSRRERLAAWVTAEENRPFARVTVNRIWALMFGKPLVEPVDSIPLHDDLPPGLELLVDDFIEHGYDIRRLIRVISKTRVYQLDSRASFEVLPKHEIAWSVYPMTRLRPEQVAGAVAQACSVSTIDSDAHIISQMMKYFQTDAFIKRYGDLGEDEFAERGISIPQRLLMMNGNLVKERTKNSPLFNASSQIAALAGNDRDAIAAAYLACYTRQPSPAESSYFKDRLKDTTGARRMSSLEDLFWALLNTTEFSWNH